MEFTFSNVREPLFARTPLDGCFYKIKHFHQSYLPPLFFRTSLSKDLHKIFQVLQRSLIFKFYFPYFKKTVTGNRAEWVEGFWIPCEEGVTLAKQLTMFS